MHPAIAQHRSGVSAICQRDRIHRLDVFGSAAREDDFDPEYNDAVKVKGVITWVAAADAVQAEVRLYDRLFAVPQPDTGDKDFLEELNPDSLKVVTAYVEPSLASAKPDEKFQFERHGYFVADRVEHTGEKPVFNRVTGMKDSWGK